MRAGRLSRASLQQFVEVGWRCGEAHEFGERVVAAVDDPGLKRVDRVVVRRRRIEGEAHHRLVIAHQRDRLVAARAPRRVERQIDRAEAVGTAVDEVAEQDDDAPRDAARLARRFVEQRGEQVAAAVDVADGEDFDIVGAGARQRVTPAVEDDGHWRVLCCQVRGQHGASRRRFPAAVARRRRRA